MATKLDSLFSWSTHITLLWVNSWDYCFFGCSFWTHLFSFLVTFLIISRWLWSTWLASPSFTSLGVCLICLGLLIESILIALVDYLKDPIIALRLHFSFLGFIFDLLLEPNIWYFHGECKCTSHAYCRVNFDVTLKLLAYLFADRKSYTMGWICLWHCPIIPKQGKRCEDALLLFFC